MRKLTLLLLMMATGLFMVAQNVALKPGLSEEQATSFQSYDGKPLQHAVVGQSPITKPAVNYKSADAVSIIDIGTSANAYGVANGGKSNLMVNNDINSISCIHRMGGALDPGGYSGDLGYDVSKDGGMTWNVMTEVYTAKQNAGGTYFIDAARYPHNAIYNPEGNTDPDEAYVAYFAATTAGSNEGWGGVCFGRGKIGDPTDTTYNFINTIPGSGIYNYVPQGFTISKGNGFWGIDGNRNWTSGSQVYEGGLIVTHGVWNTDILDFEATQFLLEMTGPGDASPADYKVEFSPDGQIGYVMALMDIGEVPISYGLSYYPVLFRTEDAGLNWSDAIPVALAGEDGIPGILNFLSDAEIAELFEAPVPDREQIPFTTSFDADISVDHFGNPHIAAIVGITGSSSAYSIVSARSAISGYLFAGAFLISSNDMGEEGSWTARLMGRPSTFRGNFGELSEDNRIQIARDASGTKMFVGWCDTDTTISTENNAPDIWCRGYDIIANTLTADATVNPEPTNVTWGSEATFQTYFFGMANEIFDDGLGAYTVPFFYQELEGGDPALGVQIKYITDFKFTDADFTVVGIENPTPMVQTFNMEVSQVMPNPATAKARLAITLGEPASVSGKIINMMGQQVSTLPARRLQAGSNELVLDVNGLSAGIYFCTLTSGTESVTRKMIVK